MKRIMEIGTFKAGDSRLEVLDLTQLDITINENTAVFVGRSTVTGSVRGHDYSDSYRIGKAYLKQDDQWRMVVSERVRLPREISLKSTGLNVGVICQSSLRLWSVYC